MLHSRGSATLGQVETPQWPQWSQCLNKARHLCYSRPVKILRKIDHDSRIRAPSFAKERPCHDHRRRFGSASFQDSASTSATLSGGQGFLAPRALSLAVRKEQTRTRSRPRARPRGLKRFELHAWHRRKSVSPGLSRRPPEPTQLWRNRSSDSHTLQFRNEQRLPRRIPRTLERRRLWTTLLRRILHGRQSRHQNGGRVCRRPA